MFVLFFIFNQAKKESVVSILCKVTVFYATQQIISKKLTLTMQRYPFAAQCLRRTLRALT